MRVVEVGAPDLQRVLAQDLGDFVHDPLDADHPLRAAEAPEGGVGDGVGLAAVRRDPRVGQVVGVVGVEHGAIADRHRQVVGHAAARRLIELDTLDAAVAVESDPVVDAKVVALAGDDHVLVAVVAELGGATGLARDQGGGGGRQVAVAFLAAEGAAHAPDFHRHRMVGQAQHLGHRVLDLAGMLGRAMDGDIAVLSGHGEGDLTLEIEMLLATDVDPARQLVRGGLDGPGGIAPGHDGGCLQKRFRVHGLVDGDDGRQVLVVDPGQTRRRAGRLQRLGGDGEQGLAGIFDQTIGEQRVVAHRRADVVGPGDIGGADHTDHAGGAFHRREIHALYPRVGAGAHGHVNR